MRPFSRLRTGLLLALAALGAGCEGRDPVILRLDASEVRRSDFVKYLAGVEARARGPLPGGAAADDERRGVARLLAREVKAPEVSEAEIRDYYGRHEPELARPARVALRQILVGTLNEARDVTGPPARNPRAFDAIARSQSKGPEAENGGYMGAF